MFTHKSNVLGIQLSFMPKHSLRCLYYEYKKMDIFIPFETSKLREWLATWDSICLSLFIYPVLITGLFSYVPHLSL